VGCRRHRLPLAPGPWPQMQTHADGSPKPSYNPLCDDGWRIICEDPDLAPSAKLAWLELRRLANGKPGTVQITMIGLGASFGRDKRTATQASITLIDAGWVEKIDSPRRGRPSSRGFWALYVGEPAELKKARRRPTDAQTTFVTDSGCPDEQPEPGEKDETVQFSPFSGEAAPSGPRKEEKFKPPFPSEPLPSEPSGPSVEQTTGAQPIGMSIAQRREALAEGTENVIYRRRREQRIQEITRRVADRRFRMVLAIRVADAEQSGLLDSLETESVLAALDDARRDGTLESPWRFFYGCMRKRFRRLGIPWPDGRDGENDQRGR
jgi:hypothetical protein